MSTQQDSNAGKIFIKPGTMPDGTPMQARKPMGGHLATEGEWVVPDSHWLRRIADRDVVETTPPKAATGKAA